MKVVHVIDHLGAGGAQKLLSDLVVRQRQRGIDASIVCLRGSTDLSQQLVSNGVPVHCLHARRSDSRQLWWLIDVLRGDRPVIIHTHLFMSSLLSRYVAVMLNIEGLVVHDHESSSEVDVAPGWLIVLRRLVERHDGLQRVRYITISRSATEYACTVRRLPKHQVVLIPNGIDFDYFQHGNENKSESRALLGLPRSRTILGCAGRFSYQKGLDILIRALPYLPQNIVVAFAGSGPLESALLAEATRLGVQDQLVMLGQLEDVRLLLRACDIYVQPSRQESFGLAALEASAMGLPVVASAVGGLRDVVVDGVTGVLILPNDAQLLAETVNNLLSDERKCMTMGQAGRDYVSDRYDVHRMTDDIRVVYEGLINTVPPLDPQMQHAA